MVGCGEAGRRDGPGPAPRPHHGTRVRSPRTRLRATGTALRAGHFLVHGAKMPIAQVDFAGAARMTPPFERVAHSFSWLADLEACVAA